MKLLTRRFSPISSYLCPFKSRYLPHILYSHGSDKVIAVFSVCHHAVWLLFTSVALPSQVASVTSYQTAWCYMPEGGHSNGSTIFTRLETHIF